jgi:hypothetical protein
METIPNRQSAGKQVEFKPVIGFEDRYLVTSDGKIFSLYLNDYLKPFFSKGGYVRVKLNFGDRSKKFMVHRLVAQAFIPNPEDKLCVNHIDFNRANNKLDNLEWVTHSENMKHTVEAGHKDVNLYVLTNKELDKRYEFTGYREIKKVFNKICFRFLREISNTGRVPMSGALTGWEVQKFDLKLQRLSSAEEYTQVSGNGKIPS